MRFPSGVQNGGNMAEGINWLGHGFAVELDVALKSTLLLCVLHLVVALIERRSPVLASTLCHAVLAGLLLLPPAS